MLAFHMRESRNPSQDAGKHARVYATLVFDTALPTILGRMAQKARESPGSGPLKAVHFRGHLLSPQARLRTEEFDSGADPDYWKGEVFAYVGLPQNLKD